MNSITQQKRAAFFLLSHKLNKKAAPTRNRILVELPNANKPTISSCASAVVDFCLAYRVWIITF